MTTSVEKSSMKILLLEGVHDRAVENFTRHGYTKIERHKKALAGDDLRAAVADVHFVGIRSRTRLTAEALAGARKLMAVGAFCIGTNQIDLDAAMMRGVPVFNAPFSNTRSVAELVQIAKAGSCRWIRQSFPHRAGFDWQGGYAAFSVSPRDDEHLMDYIRHQEHRHRERDFAGEYVALLEQHGVPYDLRTVLD